MLIREKSQGDHQETLYRSVLPFPQGYAHREGLAIEADFSLHVIRALDQIIEWRGKPKAIRCDNGPEHTSHLLAAWTNKHNITLMFIQPGNP